LEACLRDAAKKQEFVWIHRNDKLTPMFSTNIVFSDSESFWEMFCKIVIYVDPNLHSKEWVETETKKIKAIYPKIVEHEVRELKFMLTKEVKNRFLNLVSWKPKFIPSSIMKKDHDQFLQLWPSVKLIAKNDKTKTKIFICTDASSQQFICKVFSKESFIEGSKRKRHLISEIEIHLNLSKHENIVECFHATENNTHIFMYMEKCETDLFSWLKKNGPLTQFYAKKLFKQMVQATEFLHNEHSIMHRDLKLANIFYNLSTQTIKIGDFGMAKKNNSLKSNNSIWTCC